MLLVFQNLRWSNNKMTLTYTFEGECDEEFRVKIVNEIKKLFITK